ncbi:MAG: CDP-alcohol phosphatidyltransferase family protein [Rhodobacter sp.]|nr:CDP-alcohol phosphatidyltransferase family protein [Rhodobacter sp.]
MLDARMRKLIDPPLTGAGLWLARLGVSANALTLAGLALGLLMAAMLAAGFAALALVPLAFSRLCDGLDGAVARARGATDFGGYLDIFCDFVFYGAVPLAFVLRDPAANGVAGAFLLACFYVNGTSFLGYAVLAGKRGLETREQGEKTLYYSAGLLEGTETIRARPRPDPDERALHSNKKPQSPDPTARLRLPCPALCGTSQADRP